ncbi:hypothetical protein ABEB36_013264 [Hypothenemus hampei]|uniref:Uncharacterized protein n=1 Tax=Hypothenemus hampei TaxID=57062 RepID=A0ABD1E7E6_HYPHA
MDQVIIFDKSLQVRLEEYKKVFYGSDPLPYSKIKNDWSYYLELVMDPNGWQAVWKIPRVKCEKLQIPFPSMVLVYVIQVYFPNLTAKVQILSVPVDVHIHDKHFVPLDQLWATKIQDKTIGLNMNMTADALDMYRFFYIYLVMPWDEDEDSADWKTEHLTTRLRFYYDLRNGKIPPAVCEHVFSLLNEARRISSKREALINKCENWDSDTELEDSQFDEIAELNVRLIEIQNEISLLENELFRKVILKRQQVSGTIELNDKPGIVMICNEDTTENYINLLQLVQELYKNQPIKIRPNLMARLDSSIEKDTILLAPGTHTIKFEGALLKSIFINGLGSPHQVQIASMAENVMLDCLGHLIEMENITFNCQTTQCAILVRTGKVKLTNCKLIGNTSSSTHNGILVLKGAALELISCELVGFFTAVIGNSGAEIIMSNCTLKEAFYGVKVHDDCKLTIRSSVICDCKEYGILVETERKLYQENCSGSFDILKSVPNMRLESLQGEKNQKGDAIVETFQIEAMKDLFEFPDFGTIMDESVESDFQQDEINSTVIENRI